MLRRAALIAATCGTFLAVPGVAIAAPPIAGGDGVIVCNEAENSPRGGYTVNGGPVDPNPPARLRGSQMKIGDGAGVVTAAYHSPALRTCGPTVTEAPVLEAPVLEAPVTEPIYDGGWGDILN